MVIIMVVIMGVTEDIVIENIIDDTTVTENIIGDITGITENIMDDTMVIAIPINIDIEGIGIIGTGTIVRIMVMATVIPTIITVI